MTLEHLLREPAGEPEGAFVLIHGRGTSEHDLYPLFDQLDPGKRLLGIAPGGPVTGVPPGGKHWYLVPRVGFPDPQTFHSSYELLGSFLDGILAERGLGWDRTLLGGFSMGAVMSYSLGLGPARPTPAAIMALSGFVPTVDGWKPEFAGRVGLQALIHHGRADPIISVEFGRAARDLLEAGGLSVTYFETDAGHSVPGELLPELQRLVASVVG